MVITGSRDLAKITATAQQLVSDAGAGAVLELAARRREEPVGATASPVRVRTAQATREVA